MSKNIKTSNKITKKRIIQYLKYVTPLFILEISILILLFFFNKNIGKYFGIIFTALNGLAFFIFLAIFDAGSAIALRKKGFKVDNLNYKKQDIINIYNSFKLMAIARGLINFICLVSIVSISLLFFI